MAQEAGRQPSPHDPYRVTEEAVRSGRRCELRFDGATPTICRLETGKPVWHKRRENGFLTAYGSVRPLNPPLTDGEMAEIAAEDAVAEESAGRVDSPDHADA